MLTDYEKTGVNKYTEKRPWGNFEEFTHNESTTVKLLNVNPNSKLSLQYHKNRSEFWRVLRGNPIIIVGEKKVQAHQDDEFFIPELTHHQIMTADSPVCILEIAFGRFEEDDIIRIKDKYNRLN